MGLGLAALDCAVVDFVPFDSVVFWRAGDFAVFFAVFLLAVDVVVFFDLAAGVEAVLALSSLRFPLLERDFRCSGLLVLGF